MSDLQPVDGWYIFTGKQTTSSELDTELGQTNAITPEWLESQPFPGLAVAPPWRVFGEHRDRRRGRTFRTSKSRYEVLMVNAAIHLRRPLLITGKPGTGKSSLAYAIADELQLGRVLKWPINTRSTLQDALYRYDAIARLRDAQLALALAKNEEERHQVRDQAEQIGNYIRLGPLGSALAEFNRPRVLLIDEIDKSDIDLPNDLLHVLEEGEFEIPELSPRRMTLQTAHERSQSAPVLVATDDDETVKITNGRVRCRFFPIIIMTSNEERDFPPAFMRRCLHLSIQQPDVDELTEIVRAHLGSAYDSVDEALSKIIDDELQKFIIERDQQAGDIATDQLLNLMYILTSKRRPTEGDVEELRKKLLRRLIQGM